MLTVTYEPTLAFSIDVLTELMSRQLSKRQSIAFMVMLTINLRLEKATFLSF